MDSVTDKPKVEDHHFAGAARSFKKCTLGAPDIHYEGQFVTWLCGCQSIWNGATGSDICSLCAPWDSSFRVPTPRATLGSMKVSGFTFLRNVQQLGYPFVASIRSILPLVDEFVVALGPSEDDTEAILRKIGDPKIHIIPTRWNEHIRSDYSVKGFVYGQQKSIALFNCTGDWAFYLEGDEVVHENDLPAIRSAMERYLNDQRIEALAFDYLHFYGNANTYAWSPRWYRSEARILRNTIPAWGPEGLYFVVLDSQKKGRYPRAAHTGAIIYHYGWIKT